MRLAATRPPCARAEWHPLFAFQQVQTKRKMGCSKIESQSIHLVQAGLHIVDQSGSAHPPLLFIV
ncbi:hypothetical protein CLG96_04245 [Sphingomonas oleivorans]|uniref:Uncharacterized protein n=1 Tax=Sphingomonas oleivorans TaxID=1735121 RepID=A0A2T5G2E7_9SPHN|nr:hypothetical protein CLG96_04245 [Sphingomonas oleivorans]